MILVGKKRIKIERKTEPKKDMITCCKIALEYDSREVQGSHIPGFLGLVLELGQALILWPI